MSLRAARPALGVALGGLGALAFVLPGPARADVFGSAVLVSRSGSEQASFAHDVAISANGRYVVFDGVFAGKHGVWRRDLATDEVAEVAGDTSATEGKLGKGDAALPSISEDGEYVSFTTTARLAPHAEKAEGEAANVFVRNMNIGGPSMQGAIAAQGSSACIEEEEEKAPLAEYGQLCPFTIASAVNGRSEGLSYEGGSTRYGAVASGRSAITADGRHVVFVTTATSNLLDPANVTTPPLQVAVRDTATRTTELVSVRDEVASGRPVRDPETGGPETVRGSEGYTGAVYSDAGASPPEFKGPEQYALTPPLGASISADGSTVAWLGVNIAEQAKVLSGEASLKSRYAEPLWRRIADGSSAPTRRITGGSDPESPACIASGEQLTGETRADPCQGPFYTGAAGAFEPPGTWPGGGSVENFVPQLSADGYTAAFLAQAPTLTRAEGFARGLLHADLYVADMHGGRIRTEALQPLTELASGDESDLATTGSIVDFGISPDGTQVALSTQRTQFPLGDSAYVSTPMSEPGMSELFEVDLQNSTLTRVTKSYEGGAGEHPHQEASSSSDPYGLGDGALSPSFARNGNVLAFASTASNLAYGDGNTPALQNGKLEKTEFDGSDAFIVERSPFVATPIENDISSPPSPLQSPAWRLGVTAANLSDGRVRLYVTVPGAGHLGADAASVVRIVRKIRIPRARARRRRRSSTVTTLLTRTVASATGATVGPGGVVQITLVLAPGYASLAHAAAGLPASVTVAFSAPGHSTLREVIPVSFKATLARKPKPAKKHRHTLRGRRG